MKNLHNTTDVGGVFFAPVYKALSESTMLRNCVTYTDTQHVISGIQRSITMVASGRDWVQRMRMSLKICISSALFFASLRSRRRLEMTKQIAENVRQQADSLFHGKSDPFSSLPELAGYAIYASDGHFHKASTHEVPISGEKYAVGHIFSLNLRSRTLIPLALSVPQKTKKKEHELATLKRIGADVLRMNEPRGTKVIHIYDRAIIDYIQWYKWKCSRAIYIITREKKNSALTVIGENKWDRDDPRNNGVVADELVGPSNGYMMRRITYIDPVSGKPYKFITNEMTIPPGIIAFLYKSRWDIEKLFDETKNKMFERKAWGASEEAKTHQAAFIAMAHNLMRMLEHKLEQEEGIADTISAEKRKRRIEQDVKTALDAGRKPNAIVTRWRRTSQRLSQFLRWLTVALEAQTSWWDAVELLRPLMTNYL
jgi:hypothetical protein